LLLPKVEIIMKNQETPTTEPSYGDQRTLQIPLARHYADNRGTKKEGFGVLREINMKEKLKEKPDVDFRN